MSQPIEFNEKGTIESITAGSTRVRNNGSITKVDYMVFNGQKYGPVVYDNKVGLGLEVKLEMHLCMVKIRGVWIVCSIKHVESESIFSKTPTAIGAELTLAIMRNFSGVAGIFILCAILFTWLAGVLELGNSRELGNLIFIGCVTALIPALWFGYYLITPALQMKVTRKLDNVFGNDEIL